MSGKAAKGRVTAFLCKSNLLGGASQLISSWPLVVYVRDTEVPSLNY